MMMDGAGQDVKNSSDLGTPPVAWLGAGWAPRLQKPRVGSQRRCSPESCDDPWGLPAVEMSLILESLEGWSP